MCSSFTIPDLRHVLNIRIRPRFWAERSVVKDRQDVVDFVLPENFIPRIASSSDAAPDDTLARSLRL